MGTCEIELSVLRRASKLTFTVKLPTISCIPVTEMDRVSTGANAAYKWPPVHNNGLSERILDESLASITPYFRQASMKRAARSKYLILSRR